MKKKLLKIGEVVEILNVSHDTLRRWDKSGRLRAIRLSPRGPRYYSRSEIEIFSGDLFALAKDWTSREKNVSEPEDVFYCPDASTFQFRLKKFERQLQDIPALKDEFSLIVSIVGEIGNNSFDHNLGSWIDIRGILFAYDLNKRQIALADRGQGIFQTLKRVLPKLADDKEALKVAFTEKISGRAPERRGNGLKFVKMVVTSSISVTSIKLSLQSGNAIAKLKTGNDRLDISPAKKPLQGCLVLINF